eukprot:6009662-Pyramimonas_sp.AAC.1
MRNTIDEEMDREEGEEEGEGEDPIVCQEGPGYFRKPVGTFAIFSSHATLMAFLSRPMHIHAKRPHPPHLPHHWGRGVSPSTGATRAQSLAPPCGTEPAPHSMLISAVRILPRAARPLRAVPDRVK